MADLFNNSQDMQGEPLAARMRPRTVEEFIGQDHIMAPGRLLRRAIQADQLSSIILYGPPGTGKTTLAKVIANTTESLFISLNAVLGGVKEVRNSIEKAEEHRSFYDRRTILFVDEVHRWNKAQQDALLPWVENGTIILIGATTENPFFEVNRALVSRSRIFQLKPLTRENMEAIAEAALNDPQRGYGEYDVSIESEALNHLINTADGDARSLLNAIELAVETTPDKFPPTRGETIYIGLSTAEESIQQKAVLYDKDGDYHFDIISAFIKSLRGSDPDAALYWLAKMIHAGENPRFLFRRMLIMACEDIGPADPQAVSIVESCAAAFDRVGLPEGQFHLAHAAVYLSTCPKSNSLLGYFDARKTVEEEQSGEVPAHLKDGSRDADLGHGKGYIYPHSYRDHWAAQPYLPKNLQGKIFYHPSGQGYEGEIRNQVMRRRELQLSAMGDSENEEALTFSPEDRDRSAWLRRVSETRITALNSIRDWFFSGRAIKRHDRILISEKGNPLLLWEALRKTPEGLSVWMNPEKESIENIKRYIASMKDTEKPVLLEGLIENYQSTGRENLDNVSFEYFMGRNIMADQRYFLPVFEEVRNALAHQGYCLIVQVVPGKSKSLSQMLKESGFSDPGLEIITNIDEELRQEDGSPLLCWDGDTVLSAAQAAGLADCNIEHQTFTEPRLFREAEIRHWFSQETGKNYGTLFRKQLPQAFPALTEKIVSVLRDREIPWPKTYLFFTAQNL
jgi:putative ATPase